MRENFCFGAGLANLTPQSGQEIMVFQGTSIAF